jgi:radical SAM superfamily enzyme YgiQ (UPF0313 family)
MYAPLSVMCLASVLEEAGFPVILLDQRLMTVEEMDAKIAVAPEILFFGISSMTGSQIINGLSFAQSIRSRFGTKIPIVWGGVHPSIYPQGTISHPLVDVIVRSEGEQTIVELAQALEEGIPLSTVNGLCIKSEDGINMTPPRCIIESLGSLPIPAWHQLEEYLNPAQYPVLASICTSRGCPFNCAYCYKGGIEGKNEWRAFSVDHIMNEVSFLHDQYGFDIFEIMDENFILKVSRALELIRRFKDRGLKISLVRSNFATYKEAVVKEFPGFCDFVAYSPETGSPKIQKYINKQADFNKMKLFNARITDLGLTTVHTFIFAFPFETDEDTAATVALCKDFKKINPATRMALYQYMPYPGASLTNLVVRDYGLTFPENLEQWGKTDMYGELSLRFRPWVKEADLLFLNNFQLLFNIVFNSYEPLTKEILAIYESDDRIRRLLGDITLIPRAIEGHQDNRLDARLDASLYERFRDRIFI